jgi:hypothetical protein
MKILSILLLLVGLLGLIGGSLLFYFGLALSFDAGTRHGSSIAWTRWGMAAALLIFLTLLVMGARAHWASNYALALRYELGFCVFLLAGLLFFSRLRGSSGPMPTEVQSIENGAPD